MSFEITGKLIAKFDIVQKNETFKTREFVIENSEDKNGRVYNSYVKFQCVQDRTSMPDRFSIGDEIKVHFNIRGTKWERDGKVSYITNLDAWRMEGIKLGTQVTQNTQENYNDMPPADNDDDLPF